METTAEITKRSRIIRQNMYHEHFNEHYEEILEDELAEIDAFLAAVSDNPNSIYNYVSTIRRGAVHKWC